MHLCTVYSDDIFIYIISFHLYHSFAGIFYPHLLEEILRVQNN